jgi:hypothetical protein
MPQRQSPSAAELREFSTEQLGQYCDKWVAFSLDGQRVIASAPRLADLDAMLRQLGENPEEVLLEWIPTQDSIASGSELS